MSVNKIRIALRAAADIKKAKILQRFFKTGPGEYAEGDRFLGVVVPDARAIARDFRTLSLFEIRQLIRSPFHEERLCALMILVFQFAKADLAGKEKIFHFYLRYTRYINNWDLVDLTAKHIVGAFLFDKDKRLLYQLVKSKLLWERRIAIIATFYFIEQRKFKDTLKIAKVFMEDSHDLIHKAVGWMLREIGKRDQAVEESFLNQYAGRMPRTMLRYAIERFPDAKRQRYLKQESKWGSRRRPR